MQVDQGPLILSIETATRAGSIAVTRGGSVLAASRGDASISHSTYLLEQIRSVLAEARFTLREIEAVAVASGPGSFTGLRIGLATAKSFAATLRLPCVGVPTLHAVALAAGESPCTIALLPAGRGEVFVQELSVTTSGEIVPLSSPAHLRPESLFEKVSPRRSLKWAGEGAHLLAEEINARALSEGLVFERGGAAGLVGQNEWLLVRSEEELARSVGKIASGSWPYASGTAPQDLRAIYVRPTDAELKA